MEVSKTGEEEGGKGERWEMRKGRDKRKGEDYWKFYRTI